ncbi:hypothetical protein [Deminuibacter soli]|uniref:Uncharacterized protein n=1 Tax=Deminuibacter soli TaxID=2291815 RepID=A0A3E1NGF7_9BACT|nr:hypothetical protein [Deminuibacter soli]RFM26921.1 hypothetical protein DXN05_18220 [Deminuibacter soli]
MFRLLVLVCLLLTIGVAAKAQNIDTLIASIFFQTGLKRTDTGLVATFKRNDNLQLDTAKGWTAYPPDFFKNDTPSWHTFKFHHNNYFDPAFDRGSITVIMRRNGAAKWLGEVWMDVVTSNIAVGDSTYYALDKALGRYAAKREVEKHLDSSNKMVRFWSKDHRKKIILNKYLAGNEAQPVEQIHISVKLTDTGHG